MEYPRIPGAALLAAALLAGQASAGEVRVAVATKLAEPIRLVAASFEKDTGNKVHYTVAPTSAFLRQIAEGADFDVLLPNNKAALSELEALDRVVPGTRHTYAQNVTWASPRRSRTSWSNATTSRSRANSSRPAAPTWGS